MAVGVSLWLYFILDARVCAFFSLQLLFISFLSFFRDTLITALKHYLHYLHYFHESWLIAHGSWLFGEHRRGAAQHLRH